MKSKNNSLIKIILVTLSIVTQGYLYGQTTSEESKPQYLNTAFKISRVILKNGQVQTPLMNFNTVTGCMVFIKDNNYYDLTNPQMVDTIYINGSVFIPVGKVFYEVLISDYLSLFIQHKGELIPAGKPAAYGGTSQLSSSEYLSTIKLTGGEYNLTLPANCTVELTNIYWIRKDNEWHDFTNEKQFLKLFPEISAQFKSFIKENRIKFDKSGDLKKLVVHLNVLVLKS